MRLQYQVPVALIVLLSSVGAGPFDLLSASARPAEVDDGAALPRRQPTRSLEDAASVELRGTISRVDAMTRGGREVSDFLIYLTVGDDLVPVRLAPTWYVQSLSVRFDPGDVVAVAGIWTTAGDQRILIAFTIQKGDESVQLRGVNGRPAWVGP